MTKAEKEKDASDLAENLGAIFLKLEDEKGQKKDLTM